MDLNENQRIHWGDALLALIAPRPAYQSRLCVRLSLPRQTIPAAVVAASLEMIYRNAPRRHYGRPSQISADHLRGTDNGELIKILSHLVGRATS